jgi:hypothetical protein
MKKYYSTFFIFSTFFSNGVKTPVDCILLFIPKLAKYTYQTLYL